jgi:hypothetical protein
MDGLCDILPQRFWHVQLTSAYSVNSASYKIISAAKHRQRPNKDEPGDAAHLTADFML